ncbi:MAG: di-trans,poly-cis-decaprenylcistransferase [bacterium]|nr:di-trans,poly-cis-decaprenylcistransferase [bacterium]
MNLNSIKAVVKKPLYRVYESRILRFLERDRLPGHIGVILDGHRRYAKAEGLDEVRDSYEVGAAKFFEFLEWTHEFDIHAITCWLLSKENLERPDEELLPLCEVLGGLVDRLPAAIANHDIELRFVGSLDLLPPDLAAKAKRAQDVSGPGSRRLTIALGYGGRQEIVDATKDMITRLADEGLAAEAIAEKVDANMLASHMYNPDVPDLDLVIRTSGEARLSGFLLWQSAYAEFAFVDVLWPEFRRVDFLRALREFTHRQRRFGK